MNKKSISRSSTTIITAGSTYLDIDAYACMVAMAELLTLQGQPALAYSPAPCNYSVCKSLLVEGQIIKSLPSDFPAEIVEYIIVDVSNPDFLAASVPLEQIIAVYDHHTGFEDYWKKRIGVNTYIEFIGAAATLIYREWKKANLVRKMSRSTAKLLIAAILDNTLNLTSSNTTQEDIETFMELCEFACIDESWCAAYFSDVQINVEADMQNALLNDTKILCDNNLLPPRMAQLAVWDTTTILARLPEIREWFSRTDAWMLNIIDIQHRCSYFVCDDIVYQKKIEQVFYIKFEYGVTRTPTPYLRKEIIKKTQHNALK